MRDLSCLFSEPFRSRGCVGGATCAVFLSLIEHLCQAIELVLTEHRALSGAELALTDTSSHQIYPCTHSETTPEVIAGSWTHNAKKITMSMPSRVLCANSGTLASEPLDNKISLRKAFCSSGPLLSIVALKMAFQTQIQVICVTI